MSVLDKILDKFPGVSLMTWSLSLSCIWMRPASLSSCYLCKFNLFQSPQDQEINFRKRDKLYIKLCVSAHAANSRVPTRTGKPGKMGRHFPVREKSGNFEQTGKVRENHTKYWKILKFEINVIWYFYIIFLVIFKWTVYCLLKWIKFSVKKQNTKKILENWKKILEKSGNFVC